MKNKIIEFPGKKERGYEVKAKKNDSAEIWIYEEIGDSWFGGISAKQFKDDIKDLGDVRSIDVRINSPGGDVFDGIAIYNILKTHKAQVNVKIDGLAASIASVIAMAGDRVSMADNAMLMIHNAWTIAMGDAEIFRQTADMLEKTNISISKAYTARQSVNPEQIKQLMDAETWMTAEEALGYGLVDELSESLEMAACFDLSKYRFKNLPVKDKPKLPENASLRQKTAHMQMASRKLKKAAQTNSRKDK